MGRSIGFDVNPHGTTLVIVQVLFLLAAWIVSILRAYVKLFMLKKITFDDWFMLLGLLTYTAYGFIDVHGVITGGTGRHTAELTREGVAVALRAWYLCEVLYVPLSVFIRTSIALFLHRLVVEPWHFWVIRINILVIWVTSIIYFFIMMFQCTPPSYFWEMPAALTSSSSGSCIDKEVVPVATIVHSVFSAVSDWVLGLLPIFMLWNVRINRQTKATIAILLGLGLLAGIALLVRMPELKKIAITADFLYATVNFAIWSVLEPSVGIIAGCVATLRPLFKNWGFGLNRSRKGSKLSTGSHKWGAPRKMHKLDRITSDMTLGIKHDANGSEVEERNAAPASGLRGEGASQSCWDIERGPRSDWVAPSGITVERSINVTSYRRSGVEERNISECSSPLDLPIQGISIPAPPLSYYSR